MNQKTKSTKEDNTIIGLTEERVRKIVREEITRYMREDNIKEQKFWSQLRAAEKKLGLNDIST